MELDDSSWSCIDQSLDDLHTVAEISHLHERQQQKEEWKEYLQN